MINQNWHRWIFASVAKYFDDNKGQFPLYIEGQDPLPEELNERAELRINGPFFNETSKNIFQLSIDINLLLNVSFNDEDSHRQFRIAGYFQQKFAKAIKVYKYGDTDDDDGSYLGCLIMKNYRGDDVTVTNFGQVLPDIRVTQLAIDSVYCIDLIGIEEPTELVVPNH